MARPNRNDLFQMKWSKDGSPYVDVSSRTGQTPATMSFSQDGTPFNFAIEGGGGVQTNMKIAVQGAWKDVENMQVCIGGAWRDINSVSIQTNNAWKKVY